MKSPQIRIETLPAHRTQEPLPRTQDTNPAVGFTTLPPANPYVQAEVSEITSQELSAGAGNEVMITTTGLSQGQTHTVDPVKTKLRMKENNVLDTEIIEV